MAWLTVRYVSTHHPRRSHTAIAALTCLPAQLDTTIHTDDTPQSHHQSSASLCASAFQPPESIPNTSQRAPILQHPPSTDGSQLTLTRCDVTTLNHRRCAHAPRPTTSATHARAAQNERPCQKTSPSKNLPPVSNSCIDFLLEICILTISECITRGARKVLPGWFFDNFVLLALPCLRGPPSYDHPLRVVRAFRGRPRFTIASRKQIPLYQAKRVQKNTLHLRNVRNVHLPKRFTARTVRVRSSISGGRLPLNHAFAR